MDFKDNSGTEPKYRYALNRDKELVDIESDIVKEYRNNRTKGDFICLGCGSPLMAKLGNIRIPHFAHFSKEDGAKCKGQTYLHKLGILRFKKLYEERIKNGESFSFEINSKHICDRISCPFGRKQFCSEDSCKEIQLLPHNYTFCEKEPNDEGFYPDILLKNDAGKKIYVEIFVFHKCNEKKIESGIPIVEIKLESEQDLDILSQNVISENDERVKCYNFQEAEEPDYFNCEEKVDTYKQNFIDCFLRLKEEHEPWNFSYLASVVCNSNPCPFKQEPQCSLDNLENINITDDFWTLQPDDGSHDVYFKNMNGRIIRLNFTMELLTPQKGLFNGLETIQVAIDNVVDDMHASFPEFRRGDSRIRFFNFVYDSESKIPCTRMNPSPLYDDDSPNQKDIVTLYILDKRGMVRCKGVLTIQEARNILEEFEQKNNLEDYLILAGERQLGTAENEMLPALFLHHGKKVYSCYTCKYYESQVNQWNSQKDYGFCKEKSEDVYRSDAALTCQSYVADANSAIRLLKNKPSQMMKEIIATYEKKPH